MDNLDLTSINAGLARMLDIIDQAIEAGLDQAAPVVQAAMADTNAHGDMSGATRASYRAIPIGAGRDGSGPAAAGYAAAAAALTGYTGHAGRPLRQDSGVRLGPHERGMLLTSFTDYQDELETENAGQKAVLGPTLHQYALEITRTIAGVSREKL